MAEFCLAALDFLHLSIKGGFRHPILTTLFRWLLPSVLESGWTRCTLRIGTTILLCLPRSGVYSSMGLRSGFCCAAKQPSDQQLLKAMPVYGTQSFSSPSLIPQTHGKKFRLNNIIKTQIKAKEKKSEPYDITDITATPDQHEGLTRRLSRAGAISWETVRS